MTIIALQFTAELVKVIDFRADDNFEDQARFIFDELICENCEKSDGNDIFIFPSQLYMVQYENEDIPVHGSVKCSFCGNLVFIQMRKDLENNYSTLTAELSRAGKYATIMRFNIEGMKPNKCSLVGKFVATAEVDNSTINDIDFASGSSFIAGGSSEAAVLNQKVGFAIVDDDIDNNTSSSAD